MPFIRHARDKRGYECTFVMHAYRAGNGARTRVLYLFRSPSGMKVGRRALEPEVMEALEHTHPDLSFDWSSLLKEPALPRVEARERPPRPSRSRPEQARSRPAEPALPAVVEDESLLGRTLGAREAARLRSRYNELLQRIMRRARTPEDRDRLTERAVRLNPDEWPDPAAIQAAVMSVDAEWDAIASELPHRRRGRRGGRFRSEGRPGAQEGAAREEPPAASGIINESHPKGESNDDPTQELETGASGQSAHLDGPGDGGRFRPDPGWADGEAESAGAGAGADADDGPPGDPDVPGGNGHHSD